LSFRDTGPGNCLGTPHPNDPEDADTSVGTVPLQNSPCVTELDYVNFTSTAYTASSAQFGSASNYLKSDATFDPMGRPEATISPSGTVSFTTYNGFGEAASQWAGTTTAATPAARSAVIAAFRSWLASTQSQGQTSYSAGGTQLYLVSSSVYNLDGGATATTEYVDSNSAHNRTTAGLRRNKGDIHQRNKGDIHQIQVA
jgi:hypothetical protein